MKKTLVIANLPLSEGNCAGLASSIKLLDSNKVNRIILDNCNIDGK